METLLGIIILCLIGIILIVVIKQDKKESFDYHNNTIMKQKLNEYLEKGKATITANDLLKDFELYQKWKENNPEEWKKEQEEIARLKGENKN